LEVIQFACEFRESSISELGTAQSTGVKNQLCLLNFPLKNSQRQPQLGTFYMVPLQSRFDDRRNRHEGATAIDHYYSLLLSSDLQVPLLDLEALGLVVATRKSFLSSQLTIRGRISSLEQKIQT
jgi:hypothetical protein